MWTDRRTDGQTYIKKTIAAFYKFANVLNNPLRSTNFIYKTSVPNLR